MFKLGYSYNQILNGRNKILSKIANNLNINLETSLKDDIIKFACLTYQVLLNKDSINKKSIAEKCSSSIHLVNRVVKRLSIVHGEELNENYRPPRKYGFLIWSEDGTPRTYEEALDNAAHYLQKNANLQDLNSLSVSVLQNLGLSGFYEALLSYNIKFSDVKKRLGFEISEINKFAGQKWNFLDWSEDGIPRTYEEALENAAHYLEGKIDIENFSNGLSLMDLNELGLGDLNTAFSRYYIKWNDIKEILDIERSKSKWNFLDWSEDGIPRTYEEALENAAHYFLQNIYTERFKEFFSILEGIAPTYEQINEFYDGNFYCALNYRNIYYSDLMNLVGLKFTNKSKYDFLSWSEDGIPRTYEEALENATNYFLEEIYYNLKERLGIEELIAPSLADLRDNGYESFVSGIFGKRIHYSEVIDKAGLRFKPSKWSSFDWQNGIRTREEAFQNIINYFNSNINTEAFRLNSNIIEGFAPSLSTIQDYYGGGFYGAISQRGFKYSEIVYYLGLRHSHITDNIYKFGELSFKYDHNFVSNHTLLADILLEYFKQFEKVNFPFSIFKSSLYRASFFKFRGTVDNWILSDDIFNFFSDYIKYSENIYDNQIFKFTNKFFGKFNEVHSRFPTHAEILPHIYDSFNHVIAIEVPCFKYINTLDRYYTGHIDLLSIDGHIITILDLKRTKQQVLKSIPQLFCYYILLKDHLESVFPNIDFTIRVVGFTPSNVYEIECHSLKGAILKFLEANPIIKGKFKGKSFVKVFKGLFLE
ncbi:MAG: hypothetical protein GF311_10065 [Candidatus Lokiarchaeota archaeon]|nr:hypothetical protein [Candidatus Lokiarchaeota archaeon]